MTDLILNEDFQHLKQSLPTAFREFLKNDLLVLTQAYPLLNMLCPNRKLIDRLRKSLQVPDALSGPELGGQLLELCQQLEAQFNQEPLFRYRLPIVLSEFPIHSRAINQAIKNFNAQVIKPAQKVEAVIPLMEAVEHEKDPGLPELYKQLLHAIKEHGSHCDAESLWQLLEMISGWTTASPITLFKRAPIPQVDASVIEMHSVILNPQIHVIEMEQPEVVLMQNPFIPDFTYNFNGAGRIAIETDILIVNAFGMKLGGHLDGLAKYAPRFIPLDELHALIRRQLSHRMNVSQAESFQLWVERTLSQLGVTFIQRNEGYQSKDLLVNPFLTKLISFLSPEKIQTVLRETLNDFVSDELKPSQSELDIIAQYLFELLQSFQINPGQALGIGANWDGTINLSNEAGAYAFKFREAEAEWGRRFKQLSIHRQGPSEAKMNAAIGVTFEVQSLLSSFEYMSQLQPSEHKGVIYNALIDNLVSDLLPEPAYFENTDYKKYRKQHVVSQREENTIHIESFYEPSKQGTYFKDRTGNEKQTPMYRRAGTLDVMAFPRNTTYSEQSRVCYAGNPLGPLQLQYAQAMHKSARGHVVYNPLGPDQFLEDAFYGQVIRGDNGDYLPFIGVIPKNFDKHFKQENELCASFVIRMLQSARLIEYCPTFKKTYEHIKTQFLPPIESQLAVLPKFCADYLVKKRQLLIELLCREDRTFTECEQQFFSLFKNLIYSLYEFGKTDEHFKHSFLSYINSYETFSPMSKAKCDKLIRDISVNRPVYVSPDSLARYDEVLNYLKAMTTFFYPKPTDALAHEIARQAQLYVSPLAQSNGVKKYFDNQRLNKQTNLSRKQTPGMLFSAFKNDGPSKTIARDYKRMHDYNFPSYYRDPDGTPNGEAQLHDKFLDWGAKKLGATLQIMHKYHPLAIIHFPISETYLHAKQSAAEHSYKQKGLWALKGGLEGFFWHGLAKGFWHTATTPFLMTGDFFSWQYQRISNKKIAPDSNFLALSSAPANEPSIKALEAARSRDHLLELLGKPGSSASKKKSIVDYAAELTKNLYPDLTDNDCVLCTQKLQDEFPLDEEELNEMFKPLLLPKEGVALSALLHKHSPFINKSLVQAVFRCVTAPLFTSQSKAIIKETHTFFGLSSKQNTILKKILELYNQSSVPDKPKFLELFQFGGVIHKALLIRDQYIQKTQSFILNVFDEQWLLHLLFTAQIEHLTAKLTPENVQSTLMRVSRQMKGPLEFLLSSNNPLVLDTYFLSDREIAFLLQVNSVYLHISKEEQKQIIALCQVEKKNDEHVLSVKDKAHRKWAQFTERELRHQLPSVDEAQQILFILSKKLKKASELKPLIAQLDNTYQTLAHDESLNLFYETIQEIDNQLFELMRQQKKIDSKYSEAQTLLKNFLNISMNALINSRLDKVDIFQPEIPQNPLISVNAITHWLSKLAMNNRDLRSLLEQQTQQSPSIDHAVWRCKCIMQVLEKPKPEEKIAKTGMQSLLRFWSQHKDNVTITGEKYITTAGESEKSAYETLTKESVTMQHAMMRVQTKLPQHSIFRAAKKINDKGKEEASSSLII